MTDKKSGIQVSKFKEAARELGTDNSEKRFNEKLGKIAKQKPANEIRQEKKPGK